MPTSAAITPTTGSTVRQIARTRAAGERTFAGTPMRWDYRHGGPQTFGGQIADSAAARGAAEPTQFSVKGLASDAEAAGGGRFVGQLLQALADEGQLHPRDEAPQRLRRRRPSGGVAD